MATALVQAAKPVQPAVQPAKPAAPVAQVAKRPTTEITREWLIHLQMTLPPVGAVHPIRYVEQELPKLLEALGVK